MKCSKCGFEPAEKKISDEDYLCSVCSIFAPSKEKLNEYLNEKIDSRVLESFRRFSKKSFQGMQDKASQGAIMNRPAYGYKLESKQLIPDEESSLKVQNIFHEFLNSSISLNQLAKKHSLSINGLKKILRNFTYLGKTKFNGEILPGNHIPIISSELFNKVQSKLESLGIK